jgi:hypothetical protein
MVALLADMLGAVDDVQASGREQQLRTGSMPKTKTR